MRAPGGCRSSTPRPRKRPTQPIPGEPAAGPPAAAATAAATASPPRYSDSLRPPLHGTHTAKRNPARTHKLLPPRRTRAPAPRARALPRPRMRARGAGRRGTFLAPAAAPRHFCPRKAPPIPRITPPLPRRRILINNPLPPAPASAGRSECVCCAARPAPVQSLLVCERRSEAPLFPTIIPRDGPLTRTAVPASQWSDAPE
jgi:hypothetical protein